MKILITGGAGFIGSHLAESLLSDNHEVMIADNLSTGKIENIAHLQDNKKLQFFKADILDRKIMEQLIAGCDCIYHLAAAVGVKYVVEHPIETLITNVRGTDIVLEVAAAFNKKIFLASSSEVYGKNGARLFKETDDRVLGNTTIPRWGYSCSKALDEFLAMAYYKCKNLPVVIGRFFNICGPRQSPNYGMVIPRFVAQALNNEPMTVYGDGKQIRSFTYIKDAVYAMQTLMNREQATGKIFNIGSSEFISIGDLAKMIKKLCNSNSEINFIPYNIAYSEDFEDMFYRVPDISKLKDTIGFTPKLKLEDILKIIIRDYRGS